MSRVAVLCCVVVLLAGGGPAPLAPAAATGAALIGGVRNQALLSAPVDYAPPLPIEVVREFEPPPQPYAAGHRGVDLASTSGVVVRAAAAGTVSFAGSVAGRGVVVIVHADGVSTEYEPVSASVRVGAVVARGQVIGRVRGTHGACPVGGCLHWGARRAGVYFDPLSLLQSLGPVRLLPWTQ